MSLSLVTFFLVYYLLAGLGVNLAYHRLLAHRSLRLPKYLEYLLVTLGLPAGTPIQWVGTHRVHHSHADTELDPHSPVKNGFLFAHVGWYLETSNTFACIVYCLAGPFRLLFDAWHRPRTNQKYNAYAKEIALDPYYAAISKPLNYALIMGAHFLVPVFFAFNIGSLEGFFYFWLFLIFIYNTADSVDSIAHIWGSKRSEQSSNARDVPILGIIALGDGWHASHHEYPFSACHGQHKGQFDIIWQIIKFLRFLGIATDVKLAPQMNHNTGRSTL